MVVFIRDWRRREFGVGAGSSQKERALAPLPFNFGSFETREKPIFSGCALFKYYTDIDLQS